MTNLLIGLILGVIALIALYLRCRWVAGNERAAQRRKYVVSKQSGGIFITAPYRYGSRPKGGHND